ncbi:MAG: outer membrane beta-barrel protein [Bacteroidetes bacterium]|nr:outer membrane beta-barrel protein [Bacteroidota bacterium]
MKNGALAMCFSLVVFCGFSQTLNLRFGASVSNLNWVNSASVDQVFNKNNIGFDLLLGLDYLDHTYFNLSTNLGYVQKGGAGSLLNTSFQSPEGFTETDVSTKLNYVTVNTLFEVKVPVKNLVVPFIHVGPRVDYLVSYTQSYNLFEHFTLDDQLHKTIYGVIGGAGIDFRIKRFKVGVVFDYYWNFNKLVDYTNDFDNYNQVYDRTFTLNLQVGYKF